MLVTYKEMLNPRLTITPNRIEAKLPINCSDDDKNKFLNFFEKIVSEIGPVKFSLRGKLRNGKIEFHNNHNKILFKFEFK